MFQKRLLSAIAALAVVMSAASVRLGAQSVTTGAVGGTITDTNGQPIEGAQIQVRNNKTGTSAGGLSRATGQFVIQGIEPDNDYGITVRRIGYVPASRNHFRVVLSQTNAQDFSLIPQTNILSAVRVTGEADPIINPAHTGASSTFDDSTLHRLPTLSRNFYDFVQAVPQVSTATGFLSAGAVNIRQNAIQIDGAGSGDFFGLGATGQPGSQANAKLIPLDAVKEFQVLLSPYDVRQGNFGGMLINAVTKSGTNTFHGAAYGYTRDAYLTRKADYLHQFRQQQYGYSLSGPILKDRLFFFINPEFQQFQTPTTGPYIGSADNYIDQKYIDSVNTIMTNTYGFTGAGSGAAVLRKNPLTNVFGRIDAYLPWNTRLVLRHNFIQADNVSFGRGLSTSASPNFGLTSNQFEFSSKTNSSVAEILTNLPHGLFNEMLLSISNTRDFRTVPVTFPAVTVRGIPRTDAATTASFVFGTESSSQGNALNQRTFEFTENFTIPINNHSITIGTKDQYYRSWNLFGANSLGSWTFLSLDSLARGLPSSYTVSAPASTDPSGGIAIILANMYGLYAQDVWTAAPGLTITGGGRWDIPHFITRPPLNQSVVDAYGRATSTVPHKLTFSPRVAFNWDMTGDLRNQLRGGIGYFTGNPPFVYVSNAYGNTALSGFASLTCGGSTSGSTSSLQPAFNAANIATAPTSCAPLVVGGVVTKPGANTSLSSNINTIDPNFRFPQYQKITTAFDHRFRNGFVGSLEGLYTKTISTPFYQNLALAGVQAIGPHGRVLYGNETTVGTIPVFKPGGRTQVFDVTDVGGDYSYSVTGSLAKTFFTTFEGSLAYTYSQARNIADVTSSTAGSNYRFQRDTYSNLADRKLQRAKNDQPHKIVAMGTWRLKTLTDLSVVYSGNSGAPYDYVYLSSGVAGSGDANGSGGVGGGSSFSDDLVYVPLDAHNPNEILFTGYNGVASGLTAAQAIASAAAQADAFEAFIKATPCLRNNRGNILNRNVCRNPWQNEWDVSVGQSLQAFGGQNLQLRFDVINFGNLVNHKWGRQLFSDQGSTCGSICSATGLLTQTANVLGSSPAAAVGVYTFDPTLQRYSGLNVSSNYRMQLSMRYSF